MLKRVVQVIALVVAGVALVPLLRIKPPWSHRIQLSLLFLGAAAILMMNVDL